LCEDETPSFSFLTDDEDDEDEDVDLAVVEVRILDLGDVIAASKCVALFLR